MGFHAQDWYFIKMTFPILVMVMFLRYLPFLLREKLKNSKGLKKLGDKLPMVIMLLLSLKALKKELFLEAPYGVLELGGVLMGLWLYRKSQSLVWGLLPVLIAYLVLVQCMNLS